MSLLGFEQIELFIQQDMHYSSCHIKEQKTFQALRQGGQQLKL